MGILALLMLALQDPAPAEKLFHDLGDGDPAVRERASRGLLESFRAHRELIERRLDKGADLDPEVAARLRSILRQGPEWSDRRDLERGLDPEFAAKNADHLRALFGEDKDAFLHATDRIFRETPRMDRDVVECYLYALRKEAARGWLKDDPYVDYVLHVAPPEALRGRISSIVRTLVDHSDETVAWRSLRILAAVEGRASRDTLLKSVEAGRATVRQVALGLLADQAEPGDAPGLVDLLGHREPPFRDAAIRGLLKIQAVDRAEAIAALLDDPVYYIRRHAVEALGKLKANAQAARIVPLLADATKDGAGARDWAYLALLELRSEAAEDGTVKLLDHPEARVREYALQLLGHWKAVRHAGACARRLEDPHSSVRAAAVDAIAALDAQPEAGPVAKLLDDPSEGVRSRAAVAMGRLRRGAEAQAILDRVAAGKLGSPSAIEALIRMDARAHGEKVGEMLAEMVEKLPDLKGLFCGNDVRLLPHQQIEPLLKLAIEWKCDSCMVALARAAVRSQGAARERLLEVLSKASSPAVGEILAAVPAPATPEARRRLAAALSAAPSEKTVRTALDLVREAKPEEMFHLGHNLRGLSASPELLTPHLRDPEPRVRALVVELLCRSRDPKCAARAVELLSDTDPEVRIRAAYGLREMPTREPHAALARLLGDSHLPVRTCALQIVTELEIKECVPLLVERLKDSHPAHWQMALDALVRLDARDSWKEVAALLGDREKAPAAARVLGSLRAEGARALLARAWQGGDPVLRAEAIRALASMGAKEDLPPLDGLFVAADSILRAAAVEAAGLLKEARLEDAIARRLEDPDPKVVVAALGALAAMGASERSGAVASKLASKETAVTRAAAQALVALGASGQAGRVKERILSSQDAFEVHDLSLALLRLDPKGHMEFLLAAAHGWGGTIYYELNRMRAPALFDRVGKVRLSEIRLLEPGSHRSVAARLRAAHGIELVFDPKVPDEQASVMGLWPDTHRWLEVFALLQGSAPIFEDQSGQIRVVPVEEAKRFWLEWAAGR